MNLVWMVGIFVVAVLGTIILGLVSKWIDRKVTARVQWRVGPPLLQPLLDIVKLLGKETIVPRQARRAGFLLAPVFGFAASFLQGQTRRPRTSGPMARSLGT